MGINLIGSRAYYPSGPYIGVSEPSSIPEGNPDPSNYEILLTQKIGKSLIVKLKYHDCTNYEGIKILVYHNVSIQEFMGQKLIDPHFSDSKEYISPIARFVPTDEGFNFAIHFCTVLNQSNE